MSLRLPANHFPVLGRVDGKPATSSAVMVLGGYRYVALVATDPAHQRRGFADAAMRRSLRVREAFRVRPPPGNQRRQRDIRRPPRLTPRMRRGGNAAERHARPAGERLRIVNESAKMATSRNRLTLLDLPRLSGHQANSE